MKCLITGNPIFGIEIELNSPANVFKDIQVNQSGAQYSGGSSASLAINTLNSGSDQGADGNLIESLSSTGARTYDIEFGQSYGNLISISLGAAPNIHILGGTPSYTLQTIGLTGIASQFISPTATLTGVTPSTGVGTGQVAFGTTTTSSASNLAGYLEVNIGGVLYKLPYYH